MAINNNLPTSSEPIGTFGDKRVPVIIESVWYKFFAGLAALLVDGVLGFTVENGATAAGTTQGTALVAQTEWIEITTTPANSGVMLPNFGPGVPASVFNEGANSLKVYPPIGGKIDALAINAPYTLAASKMQVFNQVENAQWRSTQLG